jgi:phosphoenolpyruvate carboxykinase (GTP)
MDAHTPAELFDKWEAAIAKIKAAQEKYGNVIKPGDYKG